jgi:hypothetical protein
MNAGALSLRKGSSVARQTIEVLTDDLDGGDKDVQTIVLTLDGRRVETDLSAKNRTELERLLARYFQKGRAATGRSGPRRTSTTTVRRGAPRQPKYDRQAFLAWAKRKGYKVPQRGRTKTAWIEEFLASSKKKPSRGAATRARKRTSKATKRRTRASR